VASPVLQVCRSRLRHGIWIGTAWLGEAGLQGEPGKVGAAPAAGLVADAVKVGADGAHADVQLPGDLGVGAPLGD